MSDPAERERLWARRVRDLTHDLAREHDPSRLMPRVVDAAIELTDAERGFLVRVTGRKPDGSFRFAVEAARGFDRAALAGAAGAFSRGTVRRVVEGGQGLTTTEAAHGDLLDLSSVVDRRVRSIACVPLVLRGEVTGALYLDHRFVERAFRPEDLPLLQTFADQAALALRAAGAAATGAVPAAPGGARPPGGAAGGAAGEPPSDELAPEAPPGPPRLRLGGLVGGSPPMQRLYAAIERAAASSDPVLVLGEAGAGKEAAARELHARSPRSGQPFVVVPCEGVPADALARALGAAPDPAPGAPGPGADAFARAGRGAVLLDEVAALPPELQAALARRLDAAARARPGRREAASAPGPRLLAASRRDLRALVAAGALREDLFFRLDVLRLEVPPLRARPEDVEPLLAHLLARAGRPRPPRLSPRAAAALAGYAWPGNVRELDNEARRLAALGLDRVSSRHLAPEVTAGRGVAAGPGALGGRTLGDVERELVLAAVRACGGNKARAARQLGIPRTTLYRLLERYEAGGPDAPP